MLLVGGNPARGTYEQHREIYSPSYLFDTDGSAALRPVITGVTPGAFVYGDTFQVFTSAAASIVIFTLPGVFQASLTVTDNAGATSQPAFPAESSSTRTDLRRNRWTRIVGSLRKGVNMRVIDPCR